MAYNTFSFYSTVLDHVNREGMPKLELGDFSQIADLDYICKQHGAKEITRRREPFCFGRPYEDARTAFRIGGAIIINKSFGYHPDRSVTVFIPKGVAMPGIVGEFKKYFLKEPSTGETQQLPLDFLTTFVENFA